LHEAISLLTTNYPNILIALFDTGILCILSTADRILVSSMADDAAQLQARRDALQARVDLAKQQQQHTHGTYYRNPYRPHRGSYRGDYRASPYGGRGRGGPTFQNKTLVLNNASPATTTSLDTGNTNVKDEPDLLAGLLSDTPVAASPSAREYVTKRGGSNQLVAKDVFKREVATRMQSPELQALCEQTTPAVMAQTRPGPNQDEIYVEEQLFRITAGGKKLIKMKGELSVTVLKHSCDELLKTTDGSEYEETQVSEAKERPQLLLHRGAVRYRWSKHNNLLRVDAKDPR
jgi:hypothetical protein